jgi:hypothetical protein
MEMASPSPQKEKKSYPHGFFNDTDRSGSVAYYSDKSVKRATPQDVTKALKKKYQAPKRCVIAVSKRRRFPAPGCVKNSTPHHIVRFHILHHT